MVEFYYKRIIAGKKLWTDVPKLWASAVNEMLEANGYQLNEDGTVTLKPINSDSEEE